MQEMMDERFIPVQNFDFISYFLGLLIQEDLVDRAFEEYFFI
jgi:hypothetical protein